MDLNELNQSELVALAQQLHLEAHKGLPRDILIAIINGEEVQLPQRTINKKRLQIMDYVNTHWTAVSALVSCPAKTRSPWACFECSDHVTTDCMLNNRQKFMDGEE